MERRLWQPLFSRGSLHTEMPKDPQLFKPQMLESSQTRHWCMREAPLRWSHPQLPSDCKLKRAPKDKILQELLPNHWLIEAVRENVFQAIRFWSNLLLHSYWNSPVYKSVWKAGYDLYNNRAHARTDCLLIYLAFSQRFYIFLFFVKHQKLYGFFWYYFLFFLFSFLLLFLKFPVDPC